MVAAHVDEGAYQPSALDREHDAAAFMLRRSGLYEEHRPPLRHVLGPLEESGRVSGAGVYPSLGRTGVSEFLEPARSVRVPSARIHDELGVKHRTPPVRIAAGVDFHPRDAFAGGGNEAGGVGAFDEADVREGGDALPDRVLDEGAGACDERDAGAEAGSEAGGG